MPFNRNALHDLLVRITPKWVPVYEFRFRPPIIYGNKHVLTKDSAAFDAHNYLKYTVQPSTKLITHCGARFETRLFVVSFPWGNETPLSPPNVLLGEFSIQGFSIISLWRCSPGKAYVYPPCKPQVMRSGQIGLRAWSNNFMTASDTRARVTFSLVNRRQLSYCEKICEISPKIYFIAVHSVEVNMQVSN